MTFSVIINLKLFLILLNVQQICGLSSSGSGICFAKLGCFNITDDFKHITYRPFNLLPESPNIINTKFFLFTRLNAKISQLVNLTDDFNFLKSTNFDGNKETKFIIHGFIDNKEIGRWLLKMKDELLANEDLNVFLIDWSEGNGMPYAQAAANTRVVAAQTALLIKNLNKSSNLKLESCHLIGHSLGSHIAGYVGKIFAKNKKIGRITGLDPAEPYFQNMPKTVRLDRSDAQFVDVIHTDSKSILQLGLGMSQAIGHIDFYPNGGKEQPGCSESRFSSFLTDGVMEGTRQFVACNHQRAADYYIESINSGNKCLFVSYGCKNWITFSRGCGRHGFNCGTDGSSCAYLGYHSILWKKFANNSKSKKFYLKTNDKFPYCAFQYKIAISLGLKEKSDSYFGTMSLKLRSNDSFIRFNYNAQEIIAGKTYVSIIALHKSLSSINSIGFEWSKEIDILEPKTWNIFNEQNKNKTKSERIFIKQIIIKLISHQSVEKDLKFCFESDSGIGPKKEVYFSKVCK